MVVCHILWQLDHEYLYDKKKVSEGPTRDLTLMKLLNLSVTLSPFLGVDSQQFQASLEDGTEAYWVSLPAAPQGHLVRASCWSPPAVHNNSLHVHTDDNHSHVYSQ